LPNGTTSVGDSERAHATSIENNPAGVGNADTNAGRDSGADQHTDVLSQDQSKPMGVGITGKSKRGAGKGKLIAASNSDSEFPQASAGLQHTVPVSESESWYMCSTGRHFWPCKVGGATPTRIRQVRRKVIERRLAKDGDNGAWMDDVLAELRPPQGDFIGDFI
jgi:hypothetical protein